MWKMNNYKLNCSSFYFIFGTHPFWWHQFTSTLSLLFHLKKKKSQMIWKCVCILFYVLVENFHFMSFRWSNTNFDVCLALMDVVVNVLYCANAYCDPAPPSFKSYPKKCAFLHFLYPLVGDGTVIMVKRIGDRTRVSRFQSLNN